MVPHPWWVREGLIQCRGTRNLTFRSKGSPLHVLCARSLSTVLRGCPVITCVKGRRLLVLLALEGVARVFEHHRPCTKSGPALLMVTRRRACPQLLAALALVSAGADLCFRSLCLLSGAGAMGVVIKGFSRGSSRSGKSSSAVGGRLSAGESFFPERIAAWQHL